MSVIKVMLNFQNKVTWPSHNKKGESLPLLTFNFISIKLNLTKIRL